MGKALSRIVVRESVLGLQCRIFAAAPTVSRVMGCGVLIRFAGILVFEVHNPAECGLSYPVQGQHDPAPTIVAHSFDAGSGSRICGLRVAVMRGSHSPRAAKPKEPMW